MEETILIRDEGTHFSVVLQFRNDQGELRTQELRNFTNSPCFTRYQADKLAASYRARGFKIEEL